MCIYVPEDISWKSSTERTFLQSSEGEVSSMCALFFFHESSFFFVGAVGGLVAVVFCRNLLGERDILFS